jgi:thymidylate kinase
MLRVAVSGTHGVGKTTLITGLYHKLASLGIMVDMIAEQPRRICQMVNTPEFFRRGSNSVTKQVLLLLAQIQEENGTSGEDTQKVILMDRCALDHLAYTLSLFSASLKAERVFDILEDTVLKHSASAYDLVFHIPIEFPLHEDGVREKDFQFQAKVDVVIADLIRRSRLPNVKITGSRAHRLSLAQEHIVRCLYPNPQLPKERPPALHQMKSWPELFESIISGAKRHELRRNDRDFRVGDFIQLQEYDPAKSAYTGRSTRLQITYITSPETPCALSGDALSGDYVILSVKLENTRSSMRTCAE